MATASKSTGTAAKAANGAAGATKKPMGKSELIDSVAKSANIGRTQARAAVDAFIDTIEKELKKKGRVQITGFGTFSVSKRSKRTGVNPRTGEKINIAARNVPKFTPGQALKDAVG
jgi:nucleoid DNA-binding protein